MLPSVPSVDPRTHLAWERSDQATLIFDIIIIYVWVLCRFWHFMSSSLTSSSLFSTLTIVLFVLLRFIHYLVPFLLLLWLLLLLLLNVLLFSYLLFISAETSHYRVYRLVPSFDLWRFSYLLHPIVLKVCPEPQVELFFLRLSSEIRPKSPPNWCLNRGGEMEQKKGKRKNKESHLEKRNGICVSSDHSKCSKDVISSFSR